MRGSFFWGAAPRGCAAEWRDGRQFFWGAVLRGRAAEWRCEHCERQFAWGLCRKAVLRSGSLRVNQSGGVGMPQGETQSFDGACRRPILVRLNCSVGRAAGLYCRAALQHAVFTKSVLQGCATEWLGERFFLGAMLQGCVSDLLRE